MPVRVQSAPRSRAVALGPCLPARRRSAGDKVGDYLRRETDTRRRTRFHLSDCVEASSASHSSPQFANRAAGLTPTTVTTPPFGDAKGEIAGNTGKESPRAPVTEKIAPPGRPRTGLLSFPETGERRHRCITTTTTTS